MSSMYEAHEGARRAGEKGAERGRGGVVSPKGGMRWLVDSKNHGGGGKAEGRKKSFEDLGLDRTFVDAIRKAFPNVERPTRVQEELIAELVKGEKDILLKDATGSGK